MDIQQTTSDDQNSLILIKKISWGAVLAGVAVALGVTALLNLLGLGLDLTAFSFDASTVKTLSIGSYIWLITVGIVAMFIGGWITGAMSGSNASEDAIIHGVVAWAVTTLVTFSLLATAAGNVIGGMSNILSQTISGATEATVALSKGALDKNSPLAEVTKNILPEVNSLHNKIMQEIHTAYFPTEQSALSGSSTEKVPGDANSASTANKGENKQELNNNRDLQFDQILATFLKAANKKDSDSAKQELVTFLKNNTGLDEQEIDKKIDEWQQKYNDLKQEAQQKLNQAEAKTQEAAETASKTLGTVALFTFLAFFTSAFMSGLGSMWGARQR